MNSIVLPAEELIVATSLFGNRVPRGLEVPEQTKREYLERADKTFFAAWEQKGWIRSTGEEDGRSFDEGINLMLHVLGDPSAGAVCKKDFGEVFQWGIWFKSDSIVLIIREEEDLFRLCWVPVISLALGSLYAAFEEVFLGENAQRPSLNCIFFDREQEDNAIVMKNDENTYLYVTEDDEEGEETQEQGTLTWKEVFDRISLRIVKAHGMSIKEAGYE